MMLRSLLVMLGLFAREPHEPVKAQTERLCRANTAMMQAAGANRQLYHALVVLGGLETGFRERFERDGCRPNECDRGRAKHYWQAHRANCPELHRDPTNTVVAARCAASMLRYGFVQCRGWAGAYCVYAGLHCGCELGKRRAAMLERIGR